jgi:hypothetical protein
VRLTARENHPNEIHEEIITPEIKELRPAIRNILVIVIKHARRIVKNQAIDLSHAHNNLQRVSQGMGCGYESRDDEAEGSPRKLSPKKLVDVCANNVGKPYSSDSLHAQHERIRSQVPRITQRIFLPQLPEQILRGAHAHMIEREVSLEEEMDCAR